MKSACVLSTAVTVAQLSAVVAFSSRAHRDASPSTHAAPTTLFSLPPAHDDGEALLGEHSGVQQRRSFLAQCSASALLSLVASPQLASAKGFDEKGGLTYGEDELMSKKAHGTTETGVQAHLRYGTSPKLADKISSFNRVFAENGGYWENTSFEEDVRKAVASTGGPVTFYDSVSGAPLFKAPIGRSVDDFMTESAVHGWPSFRDQEVVWDNTRVLKSSGETVSLGGTHLGHNIPSRDGRNRYCINLVSIAGNPV